MNVWQKTKKFIFQKDCFHVVWIMTWKVQVLVAQLYPTLCNPMGYSLPGSSVHEILQARMLEWVVTSSSRETSWPRDWTRVSCITGRFFTIWATRGRPRWAQKLLEFLKIVCKLIVEKKKKKGVRISQTTSLINQEKQKIPPFFIAASA